MTYYTITLATPSQTFLRIFQKGTWTYIECIMNTWLGTVGNTLEKVEIREYLIDNYTNHMLDAMSSYTETTAK